MEDGLRSATRQVRRSNLKDTIAAQVRELILSGELRPGSRIDQDRLAEEAGVSKLPVREAIIELASEGLVRTIPRRGSFVAAIEPEDVLDHYKIYGLLAGLAAERAAANLSEEELDELEAVLREMDRTTDPALLEELNIRFHRGISLAGSSGRLRAVLQVVAKSLPTRFFEFTEGWADRAQRHHWEILEALRERDGDRAFERVVSHLAAGGEYAVEVLTARGFWLPDEADQA